MMQRFGFAVALTALASVAARAEPLDFGDRASATLTAKAWKALNDKNYVDAVDYAKKCVEMYEKDAIAMQKELKAPVPGDDKEAVYKKMGAQRCWHLPVHPGPGA